MSLLLENRPADEPLPVACRAHAAGLRRFATWQGASGRRYMFTAYAFDECPDIERAVALAVRYGEDGCRQALACIDLGPFPSLALGGGAMAAARRSGATELHLHLLAETSEARHAIIADLRARAPGTG